MERSSLGGTCVALAIMMLSGCASMRPTIESVTPRIDSIDFSGVTLAFDVDVRNPNPIKLKAPAYSYAVEIADSPFFSGDADAPLELPAGRTGTVTLPARINYVDLWNSFRSLADESEVPYNLSGVLQFDLPVGQAELPLSHQGTFPVLRPPKFSVVDKNVSDVSLSQAKVAVQVDVENPNTFSLGIAGVGYDLTIGEIALGKVSADSPAAIGAEESGRLTLTGEISAKGALMQLLRGDDLGAAKLSPNGSVVTPFGDVPLP